MINQEIFNELLELIPRDQWELMLGSLFTPHSGDVDVLIDRLGQTSREAIGDQAHKLKGAALLMGLSALGEAAAELEYLARRSSDPISAALWIPKLQQLSADSHAQVRALLGM